MPRWTAIAAALLASACTLQYGDPPPVVIAPRSPPPDPVVHADFERWRASLEDYVPVVRIDNQRAMGNADAAFVLYLRQMHATIHPAFATLFLDADVTSDALDDVTLVTRIEVVLDGETGRIVSEGVVQTSGVTGFDIAGLEAIERGQPYGGAPEGIRSSDGRVYVDWEFHRAADACSPDNARPYVLVRTDVSR
jgi:hypothetical protein